MMSWTWHWWLFLAAMIPCYILIGFARGAQNESNVRKYGSRADYKAAFRTEPAAIMGGTILAGAVYAAIVTAIAGFIF
jgi:hypothetical protein